MWIEYIPDYLSFNYKISFPITSENFEDRVTSFNKCFFEAGKKYDLYFDALIDENYSRVIENYLDRQKRNFEHKSEEYIKLIDLDLWDSPTDQKLSFVSFPMLTREDGTDRYKEVLSFDYPEPAQRFDLSNSYFWYDYLHLSISSNSNIWFEYINKIRTIDHDRKVLDTPVFNKDAHYVAPKFNSFIKALREVTLRFEGSFMLQKEHHTNVTEEGILINDQIIYND